MAGLRAEVYSAKVSKDTISRGRRHVIEETAWQNRPLELVAGGADTAGLPPRGHYVAPTIFTNVGPTAPVAQEEIFGPVLTVSTYRTEDEAIEIANSTHYGLAGAVWSDDPAHATSVAPRLQTGQVDINGGAFNPVAPFGGRKQSGVGRELGVAGLEEFLEYKAIQR